MKVAPAKGLKFASYEQVKKMICKNPKRATAMENFVAAGSVSLVTGVGVFPLDTLKTRLSVMNTKSTVTQAAVDLYKVHGNGFLFRCDALYDVERSVLGVNMAFHERKTDLQRSVQLRRYRTSSSLARILMSVVSTPSAQLVAYPLYCIKANLQAGEGKKSLTGEIRRVVQNKGFSGLYSGLSMNFIKALPAVAVTFTVYEQAKSMMGLT